MVTVFPRGTESSCSQLTSDSCAVVRLGSSSSADMDVEARVPSMAAHRHRGDFHGHVHLDCATTTRSGLTDSSVIVEQRLRQSMMMEAVSDEQQTPPLACERKLRREIANHNERKRMQSINAGFQSLRTLLPRSTSSSSSSSADRLSKAAVLQQAVDYISYLMHERQKLIELNRQCMSANLGLTVSTIDVNGTGGGGCGGGSSPIRCSMSSSPMVKRCKYSDGEDEFLSDDSMRPSQRRADLAFDSSSSRRHHHRGGGLTSSSSSSVPPIRERVKRRLPSQETTVDCSNAEMVAHSLQLDGGGLIDEEIVVFKEEIAVVSSSDDSMLSHDPVSSSSSSSSLLSAAAAAASSSPGDCRLSVSRRNLETIVEAIRHLEGESFYSDELSSLQSSGADSESDDNVSTMAAMSSLYSSSSVEQPFVMRTAAAAATSPCTAVQGSRLTLLRS